MVDISEIKALTLKTRIERIIFSLATSTDLSTEMASFLYNHQEQIVNYILSEYKLEDLEKKDENQLKTIIIDTASRLIKPDIKKTIEEKISSLATSTNLSTETASFLYNHQEQIVNYILSEYKLEDLEKKDEDQLETIIIDTAVRLKRDIGSLQVSQPPPSQQVPQARTRVQISRKDVENELNDLKKKELKKYKKFIENHYEEIVTKFFEIYDTENMNFDELRDALKEHIFSMIEESPRFTRIKEEHFKQHNLLNIFSLHIKGAWIAPTILFFVGAVAALLGFGLGGLAAILFAVYMLLPSESKVTSISKELVAEVIEEAKNVYMNTKDEKQARALLKDVINDEKLINHLINAWNEEIKGESKW